MPSRRDTVITYWPAGRAASGSACETSENSWHANRAAGEKGTIAMADPGSAVEVRSAGAVEGTVTGNDPDALVAQIERTRENLAQTIDTLAERVSPANNMRRLREQALEQVARPEVRLAAAAVGLAVVGFAILRIWGRRRK